MNINSRNISIVYLFLYISLLLGFYFNEDFALGYKSDYLNYRNFLFEKDFLHSFLNFKFSGLPAPVYLVLLSFLEKISFNEIFTRLIVLHFSLLIPFFFYLCLKIKYEFKANDIKILLPAIIFFSPYFRSASIWLGSENISLIFLSISLYFFLKYEKTEKKKLSFIILNTLFLALAAYIRPYYSLFSIYFFIRYYFDLNISYKLLFYIFINILLSFPAIYYVLVLNVDFMSQFLFRGEDDVLLDFTLSAFVNQFSIILTILFFYSIPFMLLNIRQNFQISNFKVKNYVFSIIFLFLLTFYFDYNFPYGGGIFFKLSNLIFENNYLFYIFSLISLNAFILIFYSSIKSKDTIFDLLLLLILFLLEIDGTFYHETYDPLLYFIFFLLIKNKIYLNFAKKLTDKKFILLILFCTSFYALLILKMIYNPIKMPMY
jgi:hypothetical protein